MTARRRPTMADVAAHAGVSLKTVSRVINREPRVATATAAAVTSAVRELGFRSNHAAASLARGRGLASIGLVIGAVDDPFYARLTSGVEQVARERQHGVLVSSSEDEPAFERDITLALAARQVDGLIVVPSSSDQSYLAADIAAGLAVVFVDRPPQGLAADCVLSDNEAGARDGTAHLLARGHRRIAFIGNDLTVYTSAERLAGFGAAHRAAGVAVDDALVVLGPRTTNDAEAATRRLLAADQPLQAIFAQNNVMTMGVWRALHCSSGRRRPGRLRRLRPGRRPSATGERRRAAPGRARAAGSAAALRPARGTRSADPASRAADPARHPLLTPPVSSVECPTQARITTWPSSAPAPATRWSSPSSTTGASRSSKSRRSAVPASTSDASRRRCTCTRRMWPRHARDAGPLGVDATIDGVRWADMRDRIFGRIDPISAGGRDYRRHGPNTTLYETHADPPDAGGGSNMGLGFDMLCHLHERRCPSAIRRFKHGPRSGTIADRAGTRRPGPDDSRYGHAGAVTRRTEHRV